MGDGDASPFRDAEAWLAERGVVREPITIGRRDSARGERRDPQRDDTAGAPSDVRDAAAEQQPHPAPDDAVALDGSDAADQHAPGVSVRDAARLAAQSAQEVALRDADARTTPDPSRPTLQDDVAAAVAFIRRSTGSVPQAEARLRAKLEDRGVPAVVVEQALERARHERLVDDAALATALVAERRGKGHAPARIRRDLRARGLPDDLIAASLGPFDAEDAEAAAFALAVERASALTGETTQAAFRRVVAYLTRRGHAEAIARKVARTAVFQSRDPERTAGH